MEISQHIKELLLTHDRVILPGLGAFKALYTPATVDKTTNTMLPPSKKIVFDAETTKSSGLLEKHMAERENISAEDARSQIDEFVKTVKSKLKAGKKVKFPELGTFKVIKDNQLAFTYEPAGNLLLDAYGLTKVSLPENVAPEDIDTADNDDTRKKRAWIIPLAALLLIIIFLTTIYFVKKDWWDSGKTYVTNIFKKDKKKDKVDDTVADFNNNETIDEDINTNPEVNDTYVENNTEIPANNDTPVSSDDNTFSDQYKIPEKGKSYLIIASMPTAALAEKEKARLASKGINVEILPSGNNRFRLSIGGFSDPNDAVVFYNDFHAKHKKINPWLWENK